jgi:hypothetical protein
MTRPPDIPREITTRHDPDEWLAWFVDNRMIVGRGNSELKAINNLLRKTRQ